MFSRTIDASNGNQSITKNVYGLATPLEAQWLRCTLGSDISIRLFFAAGMIFVPVV